MRKKNGFKFASVSVSTLDGKEFAEYLRNLLWTYIDEMRRNDHDEALDLAAFMLYCSYVSRNADELGLKDFEPSYSIGEVKENLGNTYVAASFVDYYIGLCAQNGNLPDLHGIDLRTHDLSNAVSTWAEMLSASGLSLMEVDGHKTASAIWLALVEAYASDSWGRLGGEFATPLPIADLATRLADVRGKSALDIACGNGVYLASALAKGAASICGRDINTQAVMRARIGCFFAGPTARRDIAVADALTAAPAATPAQRVFVAPPLGMRLREFDIPDKGYYADVMAHLMGDAAARTPNMEDFCVAKAFASLAEDGVAVMHVSASFLFHQQKSRQALRSALIEGDHLQTVIELPSGMIPGTGVKSALLIVCKQPTDDGVLIVDLDSKELNGKGYLAKGRGRCELTEAGIDWLVGVIERREEIPMVSTVADRAQMLASDSILCYSAYGSVYDFESMLGKTRGAAKIVGDIQAAQANIDSLSSRIADILKSFEEKGE